MELTLEHDETGHRYRLLRDGDGGRRSPTTASTADGSTLVFHHTLTEPEHRDQGYAAELVGRALDDVRPSGRNVVATCWFVAEFIDTHPEYQDLLASNPTVLTLLDSRPQRAVTLRRTGAEALSGTGRARRRG